ncbi:MAG: riboflavin synthase [Geobacter sp.]|nr:riboflavin synthase [Geobacter sp.]
MFTGLIEQIGRVRLLERTGEAARLTVDAGFPAGEVAIGDSVAINGVCLTVTRIEGDRLTFDVSPETIDRTAFRHLRPGVPVNLERALRLSDRLGGHIVSGHVDCIAAIIRRRDVSGNTVISFRMPVEFARYVVGKGSVAIDGISLTVNDVTSDGFSVNIIPHTAASTTLQYLKVGDEVNIETDILGKYVERLFSHGAGKKATLTMGKLIESGFA